MREGLVGKVFIGFYDLESQKQKPSPPFLGWFIRAIFKDGKPMSVSKERGFHLGRFTIRSGFFSGWAEKSFLPPIRSPGSSNRRRL